MALVEIIRPTMYQGVRHHPAIDGAKPVLVEINDDLLGPLINGQYVKVFESPPAKPKKKTKTDD